EREAVPSTQRRRDAEISAEWQDSRVARLARGGSGERGGKKSELRSDGQGRPSDPGPYLLACTYPRRRRFHLASEACAERLLQNLGRGHFRVTVMRRAKEFRRVWTQHHVSWLVFHHLAALIYRIVGAGRGQASEQYGLEL